jgi:hypothetical protein
MMNGRFFDLTCRRGHGDNAITGVKGLLDGYAVSYIIAGGEYQWG